jgi:hypothetical protein
VGCARALKKSALIRNARLSTGTPRFIAICSY